MILSTVKSIDAAYGTYLQQFEQVCLIIFTIEYLLRLWCCVESPKYNGSVRGRLRYASSLSGIVDLVAILPFYVSLVNSELIFLRSFRLLRLLRLFKLARYSQALQSLKKVVFDAKEQLLSTLFIVFLMLIWSSSLMYFIEHKAQPEVFSSIPMTMWWGVATLTTVGYGDVYPITPLGRILGAIVAVLGIGMFALPAGIIGSGLLKEISEKK